MKPIEHVAKAANLAREAAEKAQREADTLNAFAPHIPGEPRHIIARGTYGKAAVMACYKLRTITELRELIAALPPVACHAFKGIFAEIRPNDSPERGINQTEPCDGVTITVEKVATTGAYPCDQHAMKVNWWSDTPAGRIAVRVDFHHNAKESWPVIHTVYEPRYDRRGRQNGNSVRLRSWSCHRAPDAKSFRYGSGDPQHTPGNYLFFFADAEHRENVLDTLED